MTEASPIPVTIIGGYLGAGKTTLVNTLLRNAQGRRLAILVNEFGDLPIDADLIEAQDDEMISLAGGCVCCSYGNGMMEAFVSLNQMEPKPDHVILEASGVAIPRAISGSLSLLNEFRVEGIVVLADAETIQRHAADKYLSDTILQQLQHADLLVLNKSDLVSSDTLVSVSNWLATMTKGARVIETTHSQIPNAVFFGDHERQLLESSSHGSPHQIKFETETIIPKAVEDAHAFGQQLIDANPELVRAKGFVSDQNRKMWTVQIVGRRLEVVSAPTNAKPGMVLIRLVPTSRDTS